MVLKSPPSLNTINMYKCMYVDTLTQDFPLRGVTPPPSGIVRESLPQFSL